MLLIKWLANFSKAAYPRLLEKFICVNCIIYNKQLITKNLYHAFIVDLSLRK